MIPRRTITIWLNDSGEIPLLVQKCAESHRSLGYDSHFITLQNCAKGHGYVRDCIEAKRWAKAVDFLRLQYLYEMGGIYLDADVEVLKPFDHLLGSRLFAGVDCSGLVSNAVIGAEPGHPLLKELMDKMERNFLGSGELVFEAGMGLFHRAIQDCNEAEHGVTVYKPEFFFPYDHVTGKEAFTENTVAKHFFMKSWI